MTPAGGSGPALLAVWCLLAACLLCPARVLSAESARTLALSDFAVRAPESVAAESAWLGSALSELVQAKLRLFGGVRVLERLRVRSLLRASKADVGAAMEDPAALAAVIPAEVLIAGSVSVDPKDPRCIRVQARAFEVETSKIVLEAVFSETGDLAGLLKIAEDLARALADGLKFSYTPEQLAYAEPVKIDTLKLFVAGEGLLAAGRYREAIAAFQQSFEGNSGRYYAEAHRLQGDAYQALAKASTGEAESAIREEYLKKFKEDALLASGSLFDLGLAYETNGMWKEALEAFGDYIKAVGTTGETVRWRVDLGPDDRRVGNFQYVIENGDRLHLFRGTQWIVLNPVTGEVVANRSLIELLGIIPDAEFHNNFLLAGVEHGVLYLAWRERGKDQAKEHFTECWTAAIGPDLRIRWRKLVSRSSFPEQVWFRNGLLQLHAVTELIDADGRHRGYDLFTLSEDGELMSRLALPHKEGDIILAHGPDLRGLDTLAGTLALEKGLYDLATGKLLRAWETVRKASKRGEVTFVRLIGYPTGLPGVTWESIPEGARILREGKEALVLPGSPGLAKVPPEPGTGYLLFKGSQGYLLVNPENWTVTTLYGDLLERPAVLVQGDQHLLFGVLTRHGVEESDQRYMLPSDRTSVTLNIVLASEGHLLAKYLVNERPRWSWQAFLIGADPCIVTTGKMTRVSLAPSGTITVIPAAEAHLRMAESFLALKELDGARRSLSSFEAALPSDPRAHLIRMGLASLEGKTRDAAAAALGALASGIVGQEDAGPCLEAIRRARPEVRDVIITPAHAQLALNSMAGPGLIVATPRGHRESKLHLLVDTAAKRTISSDTHEFVQGSPIYEGAVAYGMTEKRDHVLRIDLVTGERTSSAPLTFHQGAAIWRVQGFPLAFALAPPDKLPRSPNGRPRYSPVMDVQSLDPVSLAPLARVTVPTPYTTFVGNGLVVFADTMEFREEAEVPVVILEQGSGLEVRRVNVSLKKERIIGVAATRESLLVTIADDRATDWKPAKGAKEVKLPWLRVDCYRIVDGGKAWSYRAEGWMGSNPAINGDTVAFSGYERGSGASAEGRVESRQEPFTRDGYSLKRFSHDRVTGQRLGVEPLQSIGRHRGRCRLFPGRKEALCEDGLFEHVDYWFYATDKYPLDVRMGCGEQDCKLLGRPLGNRSTIAWKDLVFESIAGGAIFVKDFAAGKGLEPVSSGIVSR